MAEQRRLTDLVHGHVGRLTYIPREDASGGPGALLSSRITFGASYFQVIGSSAELYSPSKSHVPEGSSRLWKERRTQKRWLLKAHPEAFMGNLPLDGLMEENMERFQKVEGEATDRPLLAKGQMTSLHDPSRVAGLPMLAVATGESGELLRLVRIDESRWQWGYDRDVYLNLSVIDPEDREEEVVWASDGLPISQIRFAMSLSRYEPLRWLLIQKQTSTTILQPEYHKTPMSNKTSSEFFSNRRPSRINPNPVLALSHKDTGGNAHVDVAFNPPSRGQLPQMAVMDECGYWSIWNIHGTRKAGTASSLSIDKCGHIQEGVLEELPSLSSYPAEKHGLLFVGTAKIDSFWDAEVEESERGETSAVRSQHLLVWNREVFQVCDLVSNTVLPKLPNLPPTKGKREFILDIQLSPVSQNQVFILTTRHLFWVNLFPPSAEEDAKPKPVVLLACPHFIASESLRMTTCRASEDGDTTLVFTYTPQQKQVRVYWFSMAAGTSLPQWHRQVMTLPYESSDMPTDIQSLMLHHAKLLSASDNSPRGLGSQYKRDGVHFYQGNILGKDLSVRYCICAASKEHNSQVLLPTARVGRSKKTEDERWKRKRRQFIQRMGRTFVLPDGMAELEKGLIMQRSSQGAEGRSAGGKVHGAIRVKFDGLIQVLRDSLARTLNGEEAGLPSQLLFFVCEAINDGLADGRRPLTTWHEVVKRLGPIQGQVAADDDLESDMRRLLDTSNDEAIITQLGRRPPEEHATSLISLSNLIQSFSNVWIQPLDGKLSEKALQVMRTWVAELARDVFLSTYGIMVQDTPLFGSMPSESSAGKQTPTSSTAIKSSQSSALGIPSSPPSATSVNPPDAAIQRLQLLAPSIRIGKMGSAKQSSVLRYWPGERGIDTRDYVSSVAIASDRQFDEARQRLQKIENRRRSQAEKYRLPAFGKQPHALGRRSRGEAPAIDTQPMPVHALSSQQQIPESSQGQGPLGPSVTMSQPVAGMFGDRKKAKRGKRKSGFR